MNEDESEIETVVREYPTEEIIRVGRAVFDAVKQATGDPHLAIMALDNIKFAIMKYVGIKSTDYVRGGGETLPEVPEVLPAPDFLKPGPNL